MKKRQGYRIALTLCVSLFAAVGVSTGASAFNPDGYCEDDSSGDVIATCSTDWMDLYDCTTDADGDKTPDFKAACDSQGGSFQSGPPPSGEIAVCGSSPLTKACDDAWFGTCARTGGSGTCLALCPNGVDCCSGTCT